jgi:hypothetical protein
VSSAKAVRAESHKASDIRDCGALFVQANGRIMVLHLLGHVPNQRAPDDSALGVVIGLEGLAFEESDRGQRAPG